METKYCSSCKTHLNTEAFGKNRCQSDGLQTKCKVCDTKYKLELYQKDKEKYKTKTRDNKKKMRDWFNQYRKTLKCSNEQCGDNRWYVLDFHHTDPGEKEFTISQMSCRGVGKERILQEIAKCEVLCANCHRARHYEMNMEAKLI